MRLVLPKGYRHVARLAPGREYDDVHIVVEHRGPPREGYKATTLCGIDVDTQTRPDDGGLPEWGTMVDTERAVSDRSGIWAHTCAQCSGKIRTAPVIAERFTELWDDLNGESEVHLDEQITPVRVEPYAFPDRMVAVVERLLQEGTIQ